MALVKSPTGGRKFLGEFLVRQGADYFRPLPLSKAGPVQRFVVCALLNDSDGFRHAVSEINSPRLVEELLALLFNCGIVPLIHDRVVGMQMQEVAATLTLPDSRSFMKELSLHARRLAAEYQMMDAQFTELLDCLQGMESGLVWLKGIALSRSLYNQPFHRLSKDFDLVVDSRFADEVFRRLIAIGFQLQLYDALLDRTIIVTKPDILAVTPCVENRYTQEVHATRPGSSLIELKFDPLKSGLRFKETERFFSEIQSVSWNGRAFSAPGAVDHLMLQLFNMHRRGFRLWPWLWDVHLLTFKLTEADWQEFVRRCQLEGVSLSAWAGLELAKDYLGTPVPGHVTVSLAPRRVGPAQRALTFVVGTRFVWNEKGAGELLMNLLFLGDARRKLQVIAQTVFPSSRFLARYYLGSDKPLSAGGSLSCLLLHWSLILVPRLPLNRWLVRRLPPFQE